MSPEKEPNGTQHMHDLPSITADTNPRKAKLTLWLKRSVTGPKLGEWVFDRVILKTNGFTQSLDCDGEVRARDMLSEQALVEIEPYLPHGRDNSVMAASQKEFNFGRLMLQGLVVTGYNFSNGVQRVYLAFKSFFGSVASLFAPGKAPEHLVDVECKLSTKTLNDIVLPALNLAAIGPIGEYDAAEQKVNAFVGRLRENSRDIEFYAALLSRFVLQKSTHPPHVKAKKADLRFIEPPNGV